MRILKDKSKKSWLEICAKEAFDGKDEIQAIDLLRYEEAVELFLCKRALQSS